MNSNSRIIEELIKDKQTEVYEVINRSGSLEEIDVEDVPLLINAVASIKSQASESVLKKIGKAVS
jgi:hypothetical protein